MADPLDLVTTHLVDANSQRRYQVQYFAGTEKPARIRGRVSIALTDLPLELRALPKLKSNGRYEHVAMRRLQLKDLTDDTSQTVWYQPVFKRRWTKVDEATGETTHGVFFFGRGSFWDEAVAAVASQMAIRRHESGAPREEVDAVEEDILRAARDFAVARKGKRGKK